MSVKTKTEECLELKNIKYQTMLINNNTSSLNTNTIQKWKNKKYGLQTNWNSESLINRIIINIYKLLGSEI